MEAAASIVTLNVNMVMMLVTLRSVDSWTLHHTHNVYISVSKSFTRWGGKGGGGYKPTKCFLVFLNINKNKTTAEFEDNSVVVVDKRDRTQSEVHATFVFL